MKIICLFLVVIISSASFSQQDPYLKKLGVYKKNPSNKEVVKIVDALAKTIEDSIYANTVKAETYSRVALSLATKSEYFEGEIDALLNLGKSKIYLNDLDSALILANLSLKSAKRHKLKLKIVEAYELKGNVAFYESDYEEAIYGYYEAIKISEKIDPVIALSSYVNIALVYNKIGNTTKARRYANKSYVLAKKHENNSVVLIALNLLGILEKNDGNIDLAIKHYTEGVALARQTGNNQRLAEILSNLSNIYFDQKEFDKGFELFNESMEISKVDGTYYSLAYSYLTLAENYYAAGRTNEALDAAHKSLNYSKLSGNYEFIINAHKILSEIAHSRGDHKGAYTYLMAAENYRDSLRTNDVNDAVLSAEEVYLDEKKAFADSIKQAQADLKQANEDKLNDQKIQSRELLLSISGLMLLVVSFGVFFLFKNNKLIKAKNKTVENQKAEIQLQHQKITDSINYAQRIQDAIISNETEWKKISNDYFVLFKPKDVVSGDFYWAHHDVKNNLSIWAVADCTGHGIPGAFMSMLGIGFLNEIIIENKSTDPGEILTQLRNKIISALNKDGKSLAKDGMDISICVWDKSNNNLAYAGANNPLWIIRNNAIDSPENVSRTVDDLNDHYFLHEVAPDKMPIGFQLAHPPPFTTKNISIQPNDLIVLLTDGYADQFGGEQGKKLKYKPLKKLLCDLKSNAVSNQEEFLNQAFEKWKGEHEQIDDVCLVGVSVSS